jgi:hypothetical protein
MPIIFNLHNLNKLNIISVIRENNLSSLDIIIQTLIKHITEYYGSCSKFWGCNI